MKSIDIINDLDYKEANACFTNILRIAKSEGLGDTTHYPEIEPEDLRKLNAGFDINSPEGLQEKVWFDVTFQLIRRGRENMRSMTRNTFAVGTDATGKRFTGQTHGELDKNHSENDHPFDTNGEGRIYETGGEKCPVACFLRYTSHLHPEQEALWQRPRPSMYPTNLHWYCNVPQGEKFLGGMMTRLSTKYELSQRYTNHSL